MRNIAFVFVLNFHLFEMYEYIWINSMKIYLKRLNISVAVT